MATVSIARFALSVTLHPYRYSERTMKMLRRAILALSAAATVAGILRLRGQGGVPPQTGGWRELSTRPR